MTDKDCPLTKDRFDERHIGPTKDEQAAMLKVLGYDSLEAFIFAVLPEKIRTEKSLVLSAFPHAASENDALIRLKKIAERNIVKRSLIGQGYYGTLTPAVIQRNILENPGWYTQYTPYQPEISQGRLEALLNFQTMVCDLTGLAISNASLLDEGTAAAEAMNMCFNATNKNLKDTAPVFFVSENCHPQTIELVKTRAAMIGIEVLVGAAQDAVFADNVFGMLLQYPGTTGEIVDYSPLIKKAQAAGVLVVMAADILALTLLKSPGELGADIAVGNTQRFGVPLGFGGPHAAYMSCKDDFKRTMPGRLVGVSKDSAGNPALRLALQTREQHIRREKATSNICTAQVLLAVMAGMYAVYHGPKGLKKIARRVNIYTGYLAEGLKKQGHKVLNESFFDTLMVRLAVETSEELIQRAEEAGFNFRKLDEHTVSVSLDEISDQDEVMDLLEIFTPKWGTTSARQDYLSSLKVYEPKGISENLIRKSDFLTHAVFNRYHSETEFLRYVRKLESRDLSLTASMIPLGSCTMKLNATSEMFPVSWKEFGSIHPFAPQKQTEGYHELFSNLESALAEITGFDAVSLQPNAGSQGEYAGLLAIRAYLDSKGEKHRRVCLIPKSAHGTNPASAVMAGMQVVVTNCDAAGNIDLEDLRARAVEHAKDLACLMVTYPSTHGVFEESIKEATAIIHKNGGQVYMDGANLNAQVGLCRPADIGADVCHINLHKTFCIPHGGGGPGMGPIGVAKHLAPFLPNHPCVEMGGKQGLGPVSAAPWGSASILVIPWMYIAMMGAEGLKNATEVAILNANYIAKRLENYYPVLYKGQNNLVAHECIIDTRLFKKDSSVEVEDIAKRLMDYGFHAPTVSFPVPGTLMIEPTESESRYELDRFCDAMISIWNEIKAIEQGKSDPKNNLLKNAPHTSAAVMSDNWDRPYSRKEAAFPSAHVEHYKFWPYVGRIDGVYGDRNLVCSCLPLDEY